MRKFRKNLVTGSVYAEAFEAQIYKDFLDHLYERFNRPSLIIARSQKGGLLSFFPRPHIRRSEEFFEYLLAISSEARSRARIEQIELEHVRIMLESEVQGERLVPQWNQFIKGIIDLYVPIRTNSSQSEPAKAVLVFGKYCVPGESSCSSALGMWVDGLLKDGGDAEFFPSVRPDTRRRQLQHLRILAEELPIISGDVMKNVEREVDFGIKLLGQFLGRSGAVSRFLYQENVFDQIALEEPSIDITEANLWSKLRRTLKTVVELLDITVAAVYFADYRDYTSLAKVVSYTRDREPRSSLQFKSIEEFRHITEKRWLALPTGDENTWLQPQSLLGTGHALLFAQEMRSSHLLVVAFGMSHRQRLDSAEKASLWDFVNSKLFPYIGRAFAAIDLDQLLGEAGHLLGRSVGTVKSAAESLQEILSEIAPAGQLGELEREFEVADWALKAGVMKLEVIRQNFYQIAHPPNSDAPEARDEGDDAETLRVVNVVAVVRDLDKLFAEEAKREGRIIRYDMSSELVPVKAQEDVLKLVVLNLWDNAIKFSYNHTIITISITTKGRDAVFSIEDVGLGVPSDERRAVFKPRFKSRLIDEASSRQKQGLGLGLAYCRRKIEHDFGGVIVLHSRPEKRREGERFQGDAWTTTVVFSLPLASTCKDPE
jgi:signal transduction histidine kinase